MDVPRHFLGWRRPALHTAVDWLDGRCRQGPQWDLSSQLIVLPSNRAGRRLIELLARHAGEHRLELQPPSTATPGQLPESLCHRPDDAPPAANALESLLAMTHTLRESSDEVMDRLTTLRPSPTDAAAWTPLAEELLRLMDELAAAEVAIDSLTTRLEAMLPDADADRWRALAEIASQYRDVLKSQGLIDRNLARAHAIRDGHVRIDRTDQSVVLLALTELTPMLRALLGAAHARGADITALVFGEERDRDLFDEWGGLRADAWTSRPVVLPTGSLHVVDKPRDQAHEVVRLFMDTPASDQHGGQSSGRLGGAFAGRFAADEVTVGLGDESAAAMTERTLNDAGLPARAAVGQAFSQSSPALLLAALASVVSGFRMSDFAALLRHPDIEAWLRRVTTEPRDASELLDEGDEREGSRGDASSDTISSWLTLLDRYANDTLQGKLLGEWLGEPGPAERMRAERMREAYRHVLNLVPLPMMDEVGDDDVATGVDPAALMARRAPLPRWSEPIAEALRAVYADRTLSRFDADDARLIRSLSLLTNALGEQASLDPAAATTPSVTLAEAIRLTLTRLSSQRIPSEGGDAVIELVGWLELLLDDAPAIVITGLNEGHIPRSVRHDPILPNAARTALGMEDDRHRYARDLYTLSALLATRQGEKEAPSIALVAGRRDAENGPLAPSRLLLTCDDHEVAQRVALFYQQESDAPPLLLRTPGDEDMLLIPRPDPARGKDITELSVTAFRSYLADPYRFYLKHVLRLDSLTDGAVELDGQSFGNLAHDVLAAFAREDVRLAKDPRAIRAFLDDKTDRLIAERFGRSADCLLLLQAEQLKYRWRAFAAWQAEQVRAGWVLREDLAEQRHEAVLSVDGEDFTINGRIDRVDEHPRDGFRVIDYKTSDKPRTPEEAHRAKPGEGGGWIDLQLPLYRVLITDRVGIARDAPPIDLGYVNLPKDPTQTGFKGGAWSPDELVEAIGVAYDVIRDIRAGVFWPVREAMYDGDAFEAACLDTCANHAELIRRSTRAIEALGGGG